MTKIGTLLSIIFAQKRPFRFIASRILWRTGLSRCVLIQRHGYVVAFHPSALSASLWIDPGERSDDEAFIRRSVGEGDIVVDVGANIGTLSIVAAKAAPDVRVLAIEAHPRTFRFLRQNILLNHLANIEARNFAAGERDCDLTFTDMRSDDQNRPSTDGEGIVVPVRRLDDLCAGLPRVDLLKIDTEGFELSVLRGAASTLKRTTCCYFESYDHNCSRYGVAAGDVVRFLGEAGFVVYSNVEADSWRQVGTDHNSPRCENLLAVRDPAAFSLKTGLLLR